MPAATSVTRISPVADSLDALPLFASLCAATRGRLIAGGTVRRYPANTLLFQAGVEATGLFIILSGRVRVIRVSHGRQRVVHTEGPGGTLAEVPLFEGGTLPATAEALEPTRCLILRGDSLRAIMRDDPAVALLFLRRLSSRVRELVDRLDHATNQSVPSRVAAFILQRDAVAPGKPFTLGMTQGALAEELGTVREMVVRALTRLRVSGAIEAVGRRQFRLRDRAALDAIRRATRPTSPGR